MDAGIIQGLRVSHASLVARLHGFSDADAAEPSLLAGWTRGMLVAHLSSAASAAMRCVDAAAAGETVPMYTGGEAQRDAEIEAGRHAPAATLVDELVDVSQRLDEGLASLPDQAWETPMLSRRGPIPMRVVVVQRWIDVEAHHVDLGLGYSPKDWPQQFIDVALPATMQVFPALRQRPDADRSIIGSWGVVREDGPGAWGLQADADDARPCAPTDVDCEIRGAGSTLLAILLGRDPGEPPTLAGDTTLAAALKRAFPGP